jgi:outer membrane immunogenic protein
MTMRKFVWMGAATGALIFAVQANAADLNRGGFKDSPVAYAVPMWNGCYAGVNGGYAWRETSNQFAYEPLIQDYNPPYSGIGAEGGFGGGQIGCSWQGILGTPALVVGIEGDIQGSGISGSGTDYYGENYKTSLDWFGTIRGRIGYAASNTLVYFTGGFAFGGLKQHGEDNGYEPTAVYETSATVTGYVLGGGIEYKFSPSWSLKGEYQYLNFGKHDASLVSGDPSAYPTASADGFKVSEDAFHTVRIGLNYWVHSAYEPLK